MITAPFTATVHYYVKNTPAGWRVWTSDDNGKTWSDFYGFLNNAWMPRVVSRIVDRGGSEMPFPPDGATFL